MEKNTYVTDGDENSEYDIVINPSMLLTREELEFDCLVNVSDAPGKTVADCRNVVEPFMASFVTPYLAIIEQANPAVGKMFKWTSELLESDPSRFNTGELFFILDYGFYLTEITKKPFVKAIRENHSYHLEKLRGEFQAMTKTKVYHCMGAVSEILKAPSTGRKASCEEVASQAFESVLYCPAGWLSMEGSRGSPPVSVEKFGLKDAAAKRRYAHRIVGNVLQQFDGVFDRMFKPGKKSSTLVNAWEPDANIAKEHVSANADWVPVVTRTTPLHGATLKETMHALKAFAQMNGVGSE